MLGLYLDAFYRKTVVDWLRKMIGSIMGLVSLLLALVLGILVGSASEFFET